MPESLTRVAIAATSMVAQAALAEQGFARRAPHLLRRSSDVLHAIHFQSSQWGTASEGSFTVNFVVTWASIWEAWTGRPLPKNPATATYPICIRIGQCMPENKDVWWDVSSTTDIERLSIEVGGTIAHLAPAYFSPFSNIDSIRADLTRFGTLPGLRTPHATLVHAHLTSVSGKHEEATRMLRDLLAATSSLPFKGSIQLFANRAGISVANDA